MDREELQRQLRQRIDELDDTTIGNPLAAQRAIAYGAVHLWIETAASRKDRLLLTLLDFAALEDQIERERLSRGD